MAVRNEGVRFRLFPNWSEEPDKLERVAINLIPGSVGAGPADPGMYVVDALGKPPYEPPRYTPPYRGPSGPPALPDRWGHFDHIAADDPTFMAAHLYGSARFALGVWEKYLGRKVRWRAANRYPRLELIPQVAWDNAQSGAGFLETGALRNHAGALQPFCLNFDVIAHEVGHTILFGEIGVPPPETLSSEFLAFHEAMADMVALVSIMHFDGVLSDVLGRTHGNLYVLNMLNRFGILSKTEQIRVSDNTTKMADVAGLRLGPDGVWIDPKGMRRNAHALAAPLTGAIFDLLVDIFQDGLVARGVIDDDLDVRQSPREHNEAELLEVSKIFQTRFAEAEPLFHEALRDARDVVGGALAGMIEALEPDALTFDGVARTLLLSLHAVYPEGDLAYLAENFSWRGIGIGLAEQFGRPPGRPRASVTPTYAERVAAAEALRRRADDTALNAGVLHRLINHDHRG